MPEKAIIQPKEPSVSGSVQNLLCAFEACIEVYEWYHQDQDGLERTGIADALRGSFSLLLQPEYREAWEEIVDANH